MPDDIKRAVNSSVTVFREKNRTQKDERNGYRRHSARIGRPSPNSWICSEHFVGGLQSDDPLSPAYYVPTIFWFTSRERKRFHKRQLEVYKRQTARCSRSAAQACISSEVTNSLFDYELRCQSLKGLGETGSEKQLLVDRGAKKSAVSGKTTQEKLQFPI